jgi:hypothetical protein
MLVNSLTLRSKGRCAMKPRSAPELRRWASQIPTSGALMLSPEVLEYATRSVLCWLATADEAGQPNVSPKEIFAVFDSTHVVIANIASPTSVRNVLVNPRVCVSFVDVFVQKGFKVIGTARNVSSKCQGLPAMVCTACGQGRASVSDPQRPCRQSRCSRTNPRTQLSAVPWRSHRTVAGRGSHATLWCHAAQRGSRRKRR